MEKDSLVSSLPNEIRKDISNWRLVRDFSPYKPNPIIVEKVRQGGKEAFDLLNQLLLHGNEKERIAAAGILGHLDEFGMEILSSSYEKELSEKVRSEIVWGLSQIGISSLPLLKEFLVNEKNDTVVKIILVETGRFGKEGLEVITASYKNRNRDLKLIVIDCLGKIGNPALDSLSLVFEDSDSDTQKYIINVLEKIGPSSMHVLARAVNNSNYYVRRDAVRALANIGSPALPVLDRILESHDPEVRKEVFSNIKNINVAMLALLQKGLNDSDLEVRRIAMGRMSEFGDVAFPFLEAALNDQNHDVRSTAVNELIKIGKSAIPFLLHAFNDLEKFDEGKYSRINIFNALIKLEGASFDFLRLTLKDKDSYIREQTIKYLIKKGEVSLSYLMEGVDNSSEEEVLSLLRNPPDWGLPLLLRAVEKTNLETRCAAILGFAKFKKDALQIVTNILNDNEVVVRITVAKALGNIGEEALPILDLMLNDKAVEVREQVIASLIEIGMPALPVLEIAFAKIPVDEIDSSMMNSITRFGRPATKLLVNLLQREDTDGYDRILGSLYHIDELDISQLENVYEGLSDQKRNVFGLMFMKYGSPKGIVMTLEDPNGEIAQRTLRMLAMSDYELGDYIGEDYKSVDPKELFDVSFDELVLRKSGKPFDNFNSLNVNELLGAIARRNPQLRKSIISRLFEIAYHNINDARNRAIDIARLFAPGEFAALAKSKIQENPNLVSLIIKILGGSEGTAYFSEMQSQALERFRAPLIDLEEVSFQRWNDLTRQARFSFYLSIGMSLGLFLLGVTVVVWGLILVTNSSSLSQQIGGGVLAGLASLATTFSGRFWKDPVEHMQKFSAQQTRLQAAFIGYMNDISKLRLAFEQSYASGKMTIEDIEKFQKMSKESIMMATQEMRVE